jgi:cation diffusion facilitator CzcD-associated flavoprotein CzcO
MPVEYDALVVGGGPAGLATSHELQRQGVEHLVVERGCSVGWSWSEVYESLVLHTVRRLSTLPGLPFPPGTPRFPTREDFVQYLRAYAREFALPVRPNSDAVGLERAGRVWTTRLADGTVLYSDVVVVATGIASEPYEPDLPGRDRFGGCLIHSSEYRRPEPFAGRRVLVVGAGNSAADISTELSREGARVTLSVRSGATVVPLTVAGVAIQYFGFAVAPLPLGARRFMATALGRAASLHGRSALPRAPITECTGVPVIGRHLTDALREGQIELKGEMVELLPDGARFADGRTASFDAVILATGYRAAIRFLESIVRRDPCGFARRTDDVTSADQPSLYFVGHNPDVRGGLYRIGYDAKLAARRIRATLRGGRRTATERRLRRYER